jgi:VWFA-related protein
MMNLALLVVALLTGWFQQPAQSQQPPLGQPQQFPPAQPRPAQEPPTFRSGVQLLAVDVSVIDRDGRPVPGLRPADFEVEIAGRRRGVARAEFIDFTQTTASAPQLLDVSSNQADSAAPEPRTILLVVNDESFGPTDGKAVFHRLADHIERLSPRDPLGFTVLSGRAGSVGFTTDRKTIADALRRLTGSRTLRMSGSTINVALVEALDIARGNTVALDTTVGRECAGLMAVPLQACRNDVENEARTIVETTEAEAQTTFRGLARLFEQMASLPGSKYVLLLSQGFSAGRNPDMATQIARVAAASGITLHAFHVDRMDIGDVTQQRHSPRAYDDHRLRAEGLELTVGAAGGAMHRLIADPSAAFERLAREMSGTYRLGVELDEADADGRARSISVKVSRPGVTVRSHRQVISPVSTAKLTPAERLKRSLQSPLVQRDIGLRLGAFAYRDERGAGRLVISAEADAPAKDLTVGYVVRDRRGHAVAAGDLGEDAIVAEGDAPTLILFNTIVPAGDHTVKLALVDAEGRTGSVVHVVSGPTGPPNPLALGDVIVLPGDTPLTRARPSARIPQGSRQASAYFEVYAAPRHTDDAAVLLEVADAPEGPGLVSSRGTVSIKKGGGLARGAGQLRFSPAALPPGRYFARLKVEGSDATAVRGFSIVSGSSAIALLPDESRALVPLFSVNRFLSDPLLRATSEHLARRAGANAAAQEVARALTDGTWRELAPMTQDPVVDATLRGLQRLAAGDAPEAERAFREALDEDPEFTVALALAGGAWAAVGRDREASRSWRTSLATGIEAPFLNEHVTEALLRSGDVKGTREFLSELEDSGADTSSLLRARAIAAAIGGDRKQAAAALASWVDAHPDDHEASFLLVLALYELKTIDKDSQAPFEARANQYVARGGPRTALVARWLQ